MHQFRTHNCGELRPLHASQTVRLSGWIHRKRDHGNLLFIDLRDQFGVTQCVIDTSSTLFETLEAARLESVLTVTGEVVERTADTINEAMPTGLIELQIAELVVESTAAMLPLQVNSEEDTAEEIRLRYEEDTLSRSAPG